MMHRSVFNVTAIFPEYSNKRIVIKTNFKVDPDTVIKKNVQVIAASSGIPVVYKLSVDDDQIIVTLKDWPSLTETYIVRVENIKDKLNRDLVRPLSKDIIFKAECELKIEIVSPNNNEAIMAEYNLIYFSIKQINPDGSSSSHPMPEIPLPPEPVLPKSSEESGLNKEAVLEAQPVTYHIEFASDSAFFDIVKEYKGTQTEGQVQLEGGQYYMRARAIKEELNGDWSDIITFTVIPNISDCDNILNEAQQEYLEEIMAPVEFFLEDETVEFNIVSCSNNGETYSEFYIEFNKDLDTEKLPANIIAYRRDL